WPRQARVQRRARRVVMWNQGIRPAKRQWVVHVQTTAIPIPGWALARRDTRLTVAEHSVWFRGRSKGRAEILAQQDRQAGGRPEITAVEWRNCPRCGRLLLGHEAEARRKLDESRPDGRETPCGPDCRR